MRLILPAILLALAGGVGAEPDGITSTHDSSGYTITHRLTNPATPAGTVITVQATATWYDEAGVQLGESVSEPFSVTVAAETRRRDTVVFIPAAFEVVVGSGSGDGTMVFEDGKLTISQPAPNDGAQHVFTWRMRLR